MDIAPQLQKIIDERTQVAVGALREALRVDVYRFLSDAVHSRLRARPHFLARTPPQAMASFRRSLISESDRILGELGGKIRDLRVFYGATSKSAKEEREGLLGVLAEIEEVARKLLLRWSMPGDDAPDDPDDASVDLDPRYRLQYEPSELVVWAWENLRSVDTARNQIADASGPHPPKTVEIAMHLPEALPEDRSERPTLD